MAEDLGEVEGDRVDESGPEYHDNQLCWVKGLSALTTGARMVRCTKPEWPALRELLKAWSWAVVEYPDDIVAVSPPTYEASCLARAISAPHRVLLADGPALAVRDTVFPGHASLASDLVTAQR